MTDNTKIYVGNLAYDTTQAQLLEFFEAHGKVLEANLVIDRATGQSKGFGFVTMETVEDAKKAVEKTNGAQLGGREIRTSEAKPQEKRTDNRRSGGGGGFDRRSSGGGFDNNRRGGGGDNNNRRGGGGGWGR